VVPKEVVMVVHSTNCIHLSDLSSDGGGRVDSNNLLNRLSNFGEK